MLQFDSLNHGKTILVADAEPQAQDSNTTDAKNLRAVDATTGKILWTLPGDGIYFNLLSNVVARHKATPTFL